MLPAARLGGPGAEAGVGDGGAAAAVGVGGGTARGEQLEVVIDAALAEDLLSHWARILVNTERVRSLEPVEEWVALADHEGLQRLKISSGFLHGRRLFFLILSVKVMKI